MNKILTYFVAMPTMLMLAFTSCHSGDDDDFEPIDQGDKALVNADVPNEGWSGDSDNGILKFAPSEYDSEEPNAFFAFRMKNGVCENGVLNIVMENSSQAKQLAQMLNNGTWVDLDDEEDDECYRSKGESRSFDFTKVLLKCISRSNASRSGFTLPIEVKQDGKVIYIFIKNAIGVSASDLKNAVELWCGNTMIVPDRVIFGTYTNGVYTCKNMHGMNIDYVVDTQFNTFGYCTKYSTSISFPTENWAQFFYESLMEDYQDYEQTFGESPQIRKDGKTVVIDAVIIGEISKTQVDAMIYALDWINNRPILLGLFY